MRDRLYRSRSDRMLFGVAGGMADWLDLDPSLVLLVWALLILAGGIGFVLYIVAAIVIPEEPLGGTVAAAGGAAGAIAPAGVTGATGDAPGGADWTAQRQARRAARAQRGGNGAVVFGLILVALGGWFLVNRYLNIDSAFVVPAVLIVVGGALVLVALGRSGGR